MFVVAPDAALKDGRAVGGRALRIRRPVLASYKLVATPPAVSAPAGDDRSLCFFELLATRFVDPVRWRSPPCFGVTCVAINFLALALFLLLVLCPVRRLCVPDAGCFSTARRAELEPPPETPGYRLLCAGVALPAK